MLMRNLLYTAVTRGKKYVFVVGSEPALDYAIDNNIPTQRYTPLARFLKEQF
jgi:exodeoxyribonuclease V alpha subunit